MSGLFLIFDSQFFFGNPSLGYNLRGINPFFIITDFLISLAVQEGISTKA